MLRRATGLRIGSLSLPAARVPDLAASFLLRKDVVVLDLRDDAFDGPYPHRLGWADGKAYWATGRSEIWVTEEALNPADVVALLNEAQNKKRLKLQKAHALQAMAERLDTIGKPQTIPSAIKTAVWRRDQGIPLSMGGSNTSATSNSCARPATAVREPRLEGKGLANRAPVRIGSLALLVRDSLQAA